jgi:hypothetical protein
VEVREVRDRGKERRTRRRWNAERHFSIVVTHRLYGLGAGFFPSLSFLRFLRIFSLFSSRRRCLARGRRRKGTKSKRRKKKKEYLRSEEYIYEEEGEGWSGLRSSTHSVLQARMGQDKKRKRKLLAMSRGEAGGGEGKKETHCLCTESERQRSGLSVSGGEC